MGQADKGLDSMTHINSSTVDSIVNSSENTILLQAIDPAHAYHIS